MHRQQKYYNLLCWHYFTQILYLLNFVTVVLLHYFNTGAL